MLAFFHTMVRTLFTEMDGHQTKYESRLRDYGIAGGFCVCGLRLTMVRQQVVQNETVVEMSDLLFGVLNHLTNLFIYDNACKSGLAGHVANRLPSLLDAMGGSGQMGAAVPLASLDRYYPQLNPNRRCCPEDYTWLSSSKRTLQTSGSQDEVKVLHTMHSL